MIAPTIGTMMMTAGSNAHPTAVSSVSPANQRRHVHGDTITIASADSPEWTSACPTSMRIRCTIHGISAYTSNAPHRPDAIDAYGSGTAAYATTAAMRPPLVPMTDAKRHAPSQPISGNDTIAIVWARPDCERNANMVVATSAVPVGNDDTWPKPAPHQPDQYERHVSPADSGKGTNWPTDTEPSRSNERDPMTRSTMSTAHVM